MAEGFPFDAVVVEYVSVKAHSSISGVTWADGRSLMLGMFRRRVRYKNTQRTSVRGLKVIAWLSKSFPPQGDTPCLYPGSSQQHSRPRTWFSQSFLIIIMFNKYKFFNSLLVSLG